MPVQTVDAPVTHREPSMAELRSMVAKTAPIQAAEPVEKTAAEPVTADPTKVEEHTEPVTAPGSEKQQEEVEDELPANVRKRIEQEAKKQAFFQSRIDQAVSARKAKEAELASVAGKPGSEPAKTTEPAKDARPIRPDLETFDGTLPQYKAAVADYETKFEDWIAKRSREQVSQELTEQQTREANQRAWNEAATKHGAEFPSLMETLRETLPVKLQTAISALDDWSAVAVHLAKNEADRTALLDKFKTSPDAAIAHLGKLEDRLKPAAKAVDEEPLPKPLKAVAGGVRGTTQPIDLDKASMEVFKREVNRRLGRK